MGSCDDSDIDRVVYNLGVSIGKTKRVMTYIRMETRYDSDNDYLDAGTGV